MITNLSYLTLAAIALIAVKAQADDYAWATNNGGSLALVDATTATLQIPSNGVSAAYYSILDSAGNRLGGSLRVAQNSNGALYGVDNNGTLYTINTTLIQDRNKNLGFTATKVNNAIGVSGIVGAVFVNSNLLDISSGGDLYQYDLTTHIATQLGSFNNSQIAGLAYNHTLYGAQYSPGDGAIDSVTNGTTLTPLTNSSFKGANQQSCTFAGASLLYLCDGNNKFYSYNLATNALTLITANFPGGGPLSLTPTSVGGVGGTPTPTATPTPTPTPRPTETPRNAAYSLPTGTLTVTAPETTPQGNPKCAPSYTYSATETSSFAAGATIDPNGTLGIFRFYQTTADGVTYVPVSPLAAVPAGVVWAWSSGLTNSHAPISYIGAQDGNTTPFFYGIETLQLVYTSRQLDDNGKLEDDSTQYVLDTKIIYLYPWNTGQGTAPTASFTNALTNAALQNPSPYAAPYATPSPSGDPPRLTVQMNNLYPAGKSWLRIYPGTPVTNPTATDITARSTAPGNGLWTNLPPVTIELGPYINLSTTAQTYTVEAVQQLPAMYASNSDSTPPLPNPAILNSVTFTFGFNVNSTIGTVK